MRLRLFGPPRLTTTSLFLHLYVAVRTVVGVSTDCSVGYDPSSDPRDQRVVCRGGAARTEGQGEAPVIVVSEAEEDGGLGSVGSGVSPSPPSGVDGVVMGACGRSTTDGVGVCVGTGEV